MTDVEVFVDDDRAYELWLIRNRSGWVINTTRVPSANYLILHTANCASISGRPANGERWTTDYAKVCAPTRKALSEWAAARAGVDPATCGLCMA